MEETTSKERIICSIYYLGPWGVIAFLKKSSNFEKFHAVQGLGLFYFFFLMILWLVFSLFVLPALAFVSFVGFLTIIFWLGTGIWAAATGKKVKLVGLDFLTSRLRERFIESV